MTRSPGPNRWELLFWVVAAGVAGALVMLLVLPDRLGRVAAAPPVRTARLMPHAATAKKKSTDASSDPTDEEEAPSERAEPAGDEPSRRDLEAGMDRVQDRVLACRGVENFVGLLSVRVVISRTGGVQSVSVLPPSDKTATAPCVARAVQGASFAHFRGQLHPTVELVYPFYFRP